MSNKRGTTLPYLSSTMGVCDSSSTTSTPTSMIKSAPSAVSEVVAHMSSLSNIGSGGRGSGSDVSSHAGTMALRRELDASQAMIERERTLRRLDKTKAEQTEARLRRQVAFLLEETEENRALHDEIREQSESDLRKLTTRLEEALSSLGDCERRLALAQHRQQQGGGGSDRDAKEQIWRRRVHGLEEEVVKLRKALRSAEDRVARAEDMVHRFGCENEEDVEDDEKDEILGVESGDGQHLVRDECSVGKGEEDGTSPRRKKRRKKSESVHSSPVSPAPPAVMRELTRTRIKLAEAERSGRVVERKLDHAQGKLTELAQIKERFQREQKRSSKLENEVTMLQRECDTVRAIDQQWVSFRQEMGSLFAGMKPADDENSPSEREDFGSMHNLQDSPPEVSSVLRQFRTLRQDVIDLRKERDEVKVLLDSSRRRVSTLEERLSEKSTLLSNLEEANAELREKNDVMQAEVRKAKLSERIGKSEAESMRSLLETYERREAQAKPSVTRSIGSLDDDSVSIAESEGPTVAGLRASLSSALKEIEVLKVEHEKCKKEKDMLREEHEDAKAEHRRVLDKFGKLRDALMQEREKAEKAEDRAGKAESLAGKGGFNKEKTRALHLKDNPLVQAVRDKYESQLEALRETTESQKVEIEKLRATGGASSPGLLINDTQATSRSSGKALIDAQKFNQRLKESFKEQIGMFREGVYLITGYKVDMYADSDKPRFKVRSMYAEKEEDHLMFMWPASITGRSRDSPVTSLDLLDTELAQVLSKTDNFAYVTKYNSVPAFMGSLQLNLFENQTTFAS